MSLPQNTTSGLLPICISPLSLSSPSSPSQQPSNQSTSARTPPPANSTSLSPRTQKPQTAPLTAPPSNPQRHLHRLLLRLGPLRRRHPLRLPPRRLQRLQRKPHPPRPPQRHLHRLQTLHRIPRVAADGGERWRGAGAAVCEGGESDHGAWVCGWVWVDV